MHQHWKTSTCFHISQSFCIGIRTRS